MEQIKKIVVDKIIWNLPYDMRYNYFKNKNPKGFNEKQALRKKEIIGDEVSLKGFDDLKCIFVHIPKAAGISINKALFGNLGGAHTKLKAYQLIFNKEEFYSYYKFTFVRNPWDRLVSTYFFLKKGGLHEKDKQWFDDNLAKFQNFEDFVVNWLNEENIYKWIHFNPQFEFITVNNKVLVDDIYKMETINEDIKTLASKLNVAIDLKHENQNPNRHQKYREYYSPKTKEIVRSVYKKDIELLDYQF
ncbi:sulfotransferase family 2 domain-containing protein [Psychroserpens sp. XS_ASV72]|uniref:sulfotransferase family 2 domain-containing protein n=1 Tax=Psychroserpens sp. XS_ASV72 TaxID=3241293 RepID=UPI0035139B11